MSASSVDIEIISDDDDWDPIQLNYEQLPTSLRESKDKKISSITDINDSDTDINLTQSKKITAIVNVSSTLPESFFDISRNIDLFNQCCPLKIEVVDCNKYPWYYKKINHLDSISLKKTKSEDIIYIEGESYSFNNMYLQDTKIKPKIRPVDISTYLKSNNKTKIAYNTLNKKKYETSIDYKNNQGLVGLKISCPKSVEAVLKSFTDSIIDSKHSHIKICKNNKTNKPELIEKKNIDYKLVKSNIEKSLKNNNINFENTYKHESLDERWKNKKICNNTKDVNNPNIKEYNDNQVLNQNDIISSNKKERNINISINQAKTNRKLIESKDIMYDDGYKLLTQNVIVSTDTKESDKNTLVSQEKKGNKLIIGTKVNCDNNAIKTVKKSSFSHVKKGMRSKIIAETICANANKTSDKNSSCQKENIVGKASIEIVEGKWPLKQEIDKSKTKSCNNRSKINLDADLNLSYKLHKNKKTDKNTNIIDSLLHKKYQGSTNILLNKKHKIRKANIAPAKNKRKQEVPIAIDTNLYKDVKIPDTKQNSLKTTGDIKKLSDGYKIPQINQNLHISNINATPVSPNIVHSQSHEPAISKTKIELTSVSGQVNASNKDKCQNRLHFNYNADVQSVFTVPVKNQSNVNLLSKQKTYQQISTTNNNNKTHSLVKDLSKTFRELNSPVHNQNQGQPIQTYITNRGIHHKELVPPVVNRNSPCNKINIRLVPTDIKKPLCVNETEQRNTILNNDYVHKNINQSVFNNNIYPSRYPVVQSMLNNVTNGFYYRQPNQNSLPEIKTVFNYPPPLPPPPPPPPPPLLLSTSLPLQSSTSTVPFQSSTFKLATSLSSSFPAQHSNVFSNIPQSTVSLSQPPSPSYFSLPTPMSTSVTPQSSINLPLQYSTSSSFLQSANSLSTSSSTTTSTSFLTNPQSTSPLSIPPSISVSIIPPSSSTSSAHSKISEGTKIIGHNSNGIIRTIVSQPPSPSYFSLPTPLSTSVTPQSSINLPLQYSTSSSFLQSANSLSTSSSTPASTSFLTISQSTFPLSIPPSISVSIIPLSSTTSSAHSKILEGTKIIGHNSNGIIRTIAIPPSAINRNTNTLSPERMLSKKTPNLGYSPPILPIRTYEEYFELLSETSQSLRHNDIRKNNVEKPSEGNTMLEIDNDVYNRKRKISCMESNTDMSVKKISMNDYKKKLLSDYLDEDNDVKVKIEPEPTLIL